MLTWDKGNLNYLIKDIQSEVDKRRREAGVEGLFSKIIALYSRSSSGDKEVLSITDNFSNPIMYIIREKEEVCIEFLSGLTIKVDNVDEAMHYITVEIKNIK